MKKVIFNQFKQALAWTIISIIVISLPTKTCNEIEKSNNNKKVHFEGIGDITSESYSEIADKINSNQLSKTTLMIELDNPYDKFVDRPDTDDITLEEAQAVLKRQRNNVKEYYSKTNEEILQSLELNTFGIEFKVDVYAPYIFGEFDRRVTASDLEKIFNLAEKSEITNIYVKSKQVVEPNVSSALTAIGATIRYIYDKNQTVFSKENYIY